MKAVVGNKHPFCIAKTWSALQELAFDLKESQKFKVSEFCE